MSKSYDKDPLYESLLLHLAMKEGSGLITQDWAIPHHKNPTLTGAPSWTTIAGTDKNVLDFNSGNPDFIEISAVDSADLDFLTADDFTLSGWVNADSLVGNVYWLARGVFAVDGYIVILFANGSIYFSTASGTANTQSSAGAIATGSWYFITITRDGATAKIYVNGVDVTNTPGVHTTITTANRKLHIGVHNNENDQPFDGKMGDVWIWGRALDKSEIKRLYEQTRGRYDV